MTSRYTRFRKPSQGALTYFVQHTSQGLVEAFDSHSAELICSAPDEDALAEKALFLGYRAAKPEKEAK